MAQTIEVFEPRYRDSTVLLVKYRLPNNSDVIINITKGAYKGKYLVKADDIKAGKDEVMMSKQGRPISMKVISLNKLIKQEEQ